MNEKFEKVQNTKFVSQCEKTRSFLQLFETIANLRNQSTRQLRWVSDEENCDTARLFWYSSLGEIVTRKSYNKK